MPTSKRAGKKALASLSPTAGKGVNGSGVEVGGVENNSDKEGGKWFYWIVGMDLSSNSKIQKNIAPFYFLIS